MLRFIFKITSRKEKSIFLVLCCYAVVASVLDLFSIGLGFALFTDQAPEQFEKVFGEVDLILLFGIFFGASSLVRAGSTYFNANFAFALSGKIIKKALSRIPQHYSTSLSLETYNATSYPDLFLVKFPILSKGFIFPLMQLISALIIAFVYLMIVAVTGGITIFYFIFSIIILYVSVHLLTKAIGNKISKNLASTQTAFANDISAVNSSMREFIFSKIARSNFSNTMTLGIYLRQIERSQNLIVQLPKYFVEGIIVSFFFIVMSFIDQDHAVEIAIGAGLLAQKMLPISQQVQRSVNNLQTNAQIVLEIANYFEELEHAHEVEFKQSSDFDGLFDILSNLSPGQWVQIEGPSGKGKTYIMDVFAGVRSSGVKANKPHETLGNSELYYLSQDSLILNGTLEECTGYIPSLHSVHLKMLDLQRFSSGLAVNRGNISGGERQRLAILRMLIQRPDVVLMDEATNALNADLEETIIEHIKASLPDSRVIFISHNPTLKKYADLRWEV